MSIVERKVMSQLESARIQRRNRKIADSILRKGEEDLEFERVRVLAQIEDIKTQLKICKNCSHFDGYDCDIYGEIKFECEIPERIAEEKHFLVTHEAVNVNSLGETIWRLKK